MTSYIVFICDYCGCEARDKFPSNWYTCYKGWPGVVVSNPKTYACNLCGPRPWAASVIPPTTPYVEPPSCESEQGTDTLEWM